jgi:hypothetical protein
MKAFLCAAAALALGIALGVTLTGREFENDAQVLNAQLELASLGERSVEGSLGPRVVVVNGERHNFGVMDRYAKRTHEFVLRNEGDAPLTLALGPTTCKCTFGTLQTEGLMPGESTSVTLSWDAKTEGEKFEQSAEIITNDPLRRAVHLTVHGDVIDLVRPEQEEIYFNNISANESTAASLNIHAFKGESLSIDKVEYTRPEHKDFYKISFAPLASDELESTPRATSGVKMAIELQPGLPIGSLDQTIRLTTNVQPDAPLEIRVFGNVAGDIVLSGAKTNAEHRVVMLGTLSQSEGASHTVYLLVKGPYRDQTELSLASVEPATGIAVELGPPNRDNPRIVRYPLSIEIPKGTTPINRLTGPASTKVHIAATHPDTKELTVQVRYAVTDE